MWTINFFDREDLTELRSNNELSTLVEIGIYAHKQASTIHSKHNQRMDSREKCKYAINCSLKFSKFGMIRGLDRWVGVLAI